MKHQTTAQPTQIDQPQTADAVHYPELNDAELEVVCGGGNLIGRRRSTANYTIK
jgi:hypothetical protein